MYDSVNAALVLFTQFIWLGTPHQLSSSRWLRLGCRHHDLHWCNVPRRITWQFADLCAPCPTPVWDEFLRVRMARCTIARPFPSVCLSFRYVPVFCPMNEDTGTIVRFSASGRTIWRGKVYKDIRGGSPKAGRKSEAPPIASENLTNNRP